MIDCSTAVTSARGDEGESAAYAFLKSDMKVS